MPGVAPKWDASHTTCERSRITSWDPAYASYGRNCVFPGQSDRTDIGFGNPLRSPCALAHTGCRTGVACAANLCANLCVYTAALTPSAIRARARRVSREAGGLKIVMADYLQLMSASTTQENRTAKMSEVSRSHKAVAKELRYPGWRLAGEPEPGAPPGQGGRGCRTFTRREQSPRGTKKAAGRGPSCMAGFEPASPRRAKIDGAARRRATLALEPGCPVL